MWREALESKGFRLSRSKTKYIECKFSKKQTNSDVYVKIGEYAYHKHQGLDILNQFYKVMERLIGILHIEFK